MLTKNKPFLAKWQVYLILDSSDVIDEDVQVEKMKTVLEWPLFYLPVTIDSHYYTPAINQDNQVSENQNMFDLIFPANSHMTHMYQLQSRFVGGY